MDVRFGFGTLRLRTCKDCAWVYEYGHYEDANEQLPASCLTGLGYEWTR